MHRAVERPPATRSRSGSPPRGVVAARGGINAGTNDETIRVLVGPWSQLRAERDEAVGRVDQGPQASGIWARFSADGKSLHVLDAQGATADDARRRHRPRGGHEDRPPRPVWFVTGTDDAGVEAAAGALDEATLTTGYALAVHDDRGVAVPAR